MCSVSLQRLVDGWHDMISSVMHSKVLGISDGVRIMERYPGARLLNCVLQDKSAEAFTHLFRLHDNASAFKRTSTVSVHLAQLQRQHERHQCLGCPIQAPTCELLQAAHKVMFTLMQPHPYFGPACKRNEVFHLLLHHCNSL